MVTEEVVSVQKFGSFDAKAKSMAGMQIALFIFCIHFKIVLSYNLHEKGNDPFCKKIHLAFAITAVFYSVFHSMA